MPEWKDEIRQRLAALKLEPAREAEIVEELAQHLEDSYQESLSGGATREEASRAALAAVSDCDLLAHELRQVELPVTQEPVVPGSNSRTNMPSDLWQDIRYGIRLMLKNPGFTTVAVLTLALGIGLVTIQISLVNAALLKGLPFERSERIMSVGRTDQNGLTPLTTIAQLSEWREHQESFGHLGAHIRETLDISSADFPAHSYRGAAFSAGVIELLRARPLLGRGFTTEDESVDAPLVVLLGERVWQNDFGADPNIVGQPIRVRGEPATIIGVMPKGFAFPRNEAAWINLHPATAPGLAVPGTRSVVEVIGRLHDDATLAAARAEFEVLVGRSSASSADAAAATMHAHIAPFTESTQDDDVTIMLLSLLGIVGGVLALSCLNVANLLSARAVSRARELAVRVALGASRGRIIRQMLCESTVLAVCGALGGLLLAVWAVPLVNRGLEFEANKPFWIVVDLDYSVLAAMAGMTLAVGALAGLFPALRATRRPNEMLKDITRGLSSARLGRLNRGLVIAQVALSCAVLVATSAFVDAIGKRTQVNLPFDADTTITADIRLSGREYSENDARRRFLFSLLERLRELPGVESATLSRAYPLGRSNGDAIEILGRPIESGTELQRVYYNSVTSGTFHDLNIAVREGREFADTDGPQAERVAVVNESFARRFWLGESALGKKVRRTGRNRATEEPWLTIVGVVADLPNERGPDRLGGGVLHVPLRQVQVADEVKVLLRAAQDPKLLIRPLQEAVRSLSPDVPLDAVQTVGDYFENRGRPGKVFGGLAFAFGLSGLFLATVGVYGVTSFGVQQRTREFGIRIALGAQPSDVLALVFKQGARQLALGLGAGGILGWVGSRPLMGEMARVAAPPGTAVYLFVFLNIALVVALALWLPARRAATVDPMVALRYE